MGHSSIGPSRAKRILNCPGSVGLCANLPDSPPSEYALEGQRAHAVVEAYLRQQPIPEFATEEMIQGAKDFAAIIDYDMLQYQDPISPLYPDISLHIEAKVHASSISEDSWGSCDAYFIGNGKLFVYDYKYGKGNQVDAQQNSQLLNYAVAISDEHGFKNWSAELIIFQPRLHHHSRWTASNGDLDRFRSDFKKALQSKELKVNSECKWCPALLNCKAHMDAITDKFDAYVDEPNITLKPMADITPDQFKIYLDNMEVLEEWISAVKREAFTFLTNGGIINEYQLVESLGNRKWKNERDIDLLFGKDYDVFARRIKSPAQLEKIVPKELIEPLVIRDVNKKLSKTGKTAPNHMDVFTDYTRE